MSFHPQTPQSPCHFSPATTSSDPNMSLSASIATGTTLPTPAHSVNGGNSQPDVHMTDDSPHKRKRPLDDVGDRHRKKMHLEDHKLGIEDLHLDVGDKYLLCRTRKTAFLCPLLPPSFPERALATCRDGAGRTTCSHCRLLVHPQSLPRTSEDLFEMFGLTDLAAEVAREKPNGEKNALRKTYKGHIKRLGVAGHFDVQKKKEEELSDFVAMIQVPELEWNVHQVKGREIGNGLSEATLSSLGRALTMCRGPIPKAIWDTSVLGDLAPANGDASKPASARPTAPNTPLAPTPNPMGRSKSLLALGHDPTRPRRNIKKRSYGDSSFEGYGEGFPDDDAGLDTGYSTGEGEPGQKRRKKVSRFRRLRCTSPPDIYQNSGNSPPYPTMRQQSYGPGMVGA
ncbi:Mediator of RNA polymerase II transcription subunit 19 [Tolypocladium capitatum]|uniref:Mediator of RNA polymerase II transcription subunit 19 n=1 Tax=Tolypocladium capitatum TaxID=45235 RepID=A0A2K3QNJ5_9HYPO|nr:Mediator of RNA polymerase II transcription subunit 19 [Tolypocladium capitatum]